MLPFLGALLLLPLMLLLLLLLLLCYTASANDGNDGTMTVRCDDYYYGDDEVGHPPQTELSACEFAREWAAFLANGRFLCAVYGRMGGDPL